MTGACSGIAVKSPSEPGICTDKTSIEAKAASGDTRSNCIKVAILSSSYAASDAKRSAFSITSSIPPTI